MTDPPAGLFGFVKKKDRGGENSGTTDGACNNAAVIFYPGQEYREVFFCCIYPGRLKDLPAGSPGAGAGIIVNECCFHRQTPYVLRFPICKEAKIKTVKRK